jgi:dolichol-phosphate mannosyltransferase
MTYATRASSRTRDLERRGLKLSIVIPARNEEGSIRSTLLGLAGVLEIEQIDYELLVVDDASTDRNAEIVRDLIEVNAHIRYHRSHYPPGFGFAVGSGLDEFTGDAVRSSWRTAPIIRKIS